MSGANRRFLTFSGRYPPFLMRQGGPWPSPPYLACVLAPGSRSGIALAVGLVAVQSSAPTARTRPRCDDRQAWPMWSPLAMAATAGGDGPVDRADRRTTALAGAHRLPHHNLGAAILSSTRL
jgi:hypothetical protein